MSREKVSPEAAGCWIDGHEGQYATLTLIEIAYNEGFTPGKYDVNNLDDLIFVAEEAEDWLNENLAPEGFSFGWFDGEFFLWSYDMWEENYG